VAAALMDAMALACGPDARVSSFEMEVSEPAPVGAFLDIEARVERRDGSTADASASGRVDQRMVAQARGSFRY
jgi:hypothetical protein